MANSTKKTTNSERIEMLENNINLILSKLNGITVSQSIPQAQAQSIPQAQLTQANTIEYHKNVVKNLKKETVNAIVIIDSNSKQAKDSLKALGYKWNGQFWYLIEEAKK